MKNTLAKNIICLFIIIGFIQIRWGLYVHGQDSIFFQRLDLSEEQISVYDALNHISDRINYNFSYNAGIIEGDKNVTLRADNKPLIYLLNDILQDESLVYKIMDNQIVIYRPQDPLEFARMIESEAEMPYFKEVRGTIIEKGSGDPVPYASVSIVGENLGTISNADGNFVLKVPGYFHDDTLGFSSMGFKTLTLPVQKIDSSSLMVELSMDFIPIQEVIIRKTDPVHLIKSALRKIDNNYSLKPSIYTTFYRESVKKNDDFIAISEAVLQIYKAPYDNAYENDQIKVYKSRKTISAEKLDTVILKLKGGLNTSLMLDIVKNPADFLQEKYFKFYNYNMADIVYYNDHPTYVIEFDQKESVNYPFFKGRLYIDVESLAIRGADFHLSPRGIHKAAEVMVLKKSRKMKVKPVNAKYMVNYRKINGKFYLNHIRFETRFKVRMKRKLFSSEFHTITEMAINNMDHENVKRFKFKETVRSKDIFQDKDFEYDPVFWGKFNYLKPDTPIKDAMGKLNRVLVNHLNMTDDLP